VVILLWLVVEVEDMAHTVKEAVAVQVDYAQPLQQLVVVVHLNQQYL
jgi:hypothetical protein